MFNLLATNLYDGNTHDLASSLGLIGNSGSRVLTSSCGREFSSSPGKKISRIEKKNSTFNIPIYKQAYIMYPPHGQCSDAAPHADHIGLSLSPTNAHIKLPLHRLYKELRSDITVFDMKLY